MERERAKKENEESGMYRVYIFGFTGFEGNLSWCCPHLWCLVKTLTYFQSSVIVSASTEKDLERSPLKTILEMKKNASKHQTKVPKFTLHLIGLLQMLSVCKSQKLCCLVSRVNFLSNGKINQPKMICRQQMKYFCSSEIYDL